MTYLLLRSTLAALVAFAGGGLGVLLGGVLLGAGAARRRRLLVCAVMEALLATASGCALFWTVGKHVYYLCPAYSAGAFDQAMTKRLKRSVLLLSVALGLHSAMDGVAVVVSDRVAAHPNFALLFAVSFHKLPEGLALALLLIGAGYGRRKAFWMTAALFAGSPSAQRTEIGATQFALMESIAFTLTAVLIWSLRQLERVY